MFKHEIKLKIAHDFYLPAESATQTFGILAIRGSGKTYTASVLAEEMLEANLPIVVLDPTGAWWGLRADADGKGPGYPIVVMGGDHGDVPLESTAGEVLADFVVEERQSVVLDMSHFRKGERARFVTDFCEKLYLKNRKALHLFIDEADSFAPQRPMHGEERMLGALEDIVRRGRIRGLGVTLITQRSAVINKDVLSQVEVLIALRTIGSHDRAAIDVWTEAHGTKEQRDLMMSSLASLPKGTAWFWSPGWLDEFKKIEIRKRRTFNSSATPKVGERVIEPRKLADVDLVALTKRIADTVERVKATDPVELRRRIVELEKQIKIGSVPILQTVKEVAKPKTIEVSVFKDKHVDRLEKMTSKMAVALEHMISLLTKHYRMVNQSPLRIKREKLYPDGVLGIPPERPHNMISVELAKIKGYPNFSRIKTGDAIIFDADTLGADLSKAERWILTVLAQHPGGRTKAQVALIAGYAVKGGGFLNAIGALVTKGFITRQGGDLLMITGRGQANIGNVVPLPTGKALVDHWLSKLGKAERSILQYLTNNFPNEFTKEAIAAGSGYEVKGGGFLNALGRLRTLELIEGRNEIRASENLF